MAEGKRESQPKLTDLQPVVPESSGPLRAEGVRKVRAGAKDQSVTLDRDGLYAGSGNRDSAPVKITPKGKIKVPVYDYGGGTTGFIESDADLEDGVIYLAENFGGVGTHKIRARIGGAWKEAALS